MRPQLQEVVIIILVLTNNFLLIIEIKLELAEMSQCRNSAQEIDY